MNPDYHPDYDFKPDPVESETDFHLPDSSERTLDFVEFLEFSENQYKRGYRYLQ